MSLLFCLLLFKICICEGEFSRNKYDSTFRLFLKHNSHEEIYMIRRFFECFAFVAVRSCYKAWLQRFAKCELVSVYFFFFLQPSISFLANNCLLGHCLYIFKIFFRRFIAFNIWNYVYLFEKEFLDSNKTLYTYYIVSTENPESI